MWLAEKNMMKIKSSETKTKSFHGHEIIWLLIRHNKNQWKFEVWTETFAYYFQFISQKAPYGMEWKLTDIGLALNPAACRLECQRKLFEIEKNILNLKNKKIV